MTTQRAPSPNKTPVQLQLQGLENVHSGIDPRFILSDETCRIGRIYLAQIRRTLGMDPPHRGSSSPSTG